MAPDDLFLLSPSDYVGTPGPPSNSSTYYTHAYIYTYIQPENIVIKSYSRVEIKIIDFGSSCFLTDNLTSYIQSRSYRAPEVILGARYGQKIDIWSLGCVLAELFTGM